MPRFGGEYPAAGGSDCETMVWESSGAAPDAKLAIFDAGDEDGNLDFPSNLEEYYFSAVYDIEGGKGRISVNSWGTACVSSYRDLDIQTDSYLYDNPDMVILYAAGNEGDDDSCGDYTINSPANSMNGFGVGAGETGRWPTYPNANKDPDYVAYFSSVGYTYDNRYKPDVIAPGFYVMSAESAG